MVSPDSTSPDVDTSPSDNIPFGTAPLDDDFAVAVSLDASTTGMVVPAADNPDASVLGPLNQVCSRPSRRRLRYCESLRPPRCLICEMNNQEVGLDSGPAVSVSSLFQFFRDVLSVKVLGLLGYLTCSVSLMLLEAPGTMFDISEELGSRLSPSFFAHSLFLGVFFLCLVFCLFFYSVLRFPYSVEFQEGVCNRLKKMYFVVEILTEICSPSFCYEFSLSCFVINS